MALVVAAFASAIPRVCEWWDSTDEIVKTLMIQLESEDKQTRDNAWVVAIDQIKKRPGWHSAYLVSKGFGDIIILRPIVKRIFVWLVDLFHYLRSIYAQPREVLMAAFTAIRERIGLFIERIKSFAITAAEYLSPQVAYERLRNLFHSISFSVVGQALTSAWRMLFGAFSVVFQWLMHLLPIIKHELFKYAIQLAGCIMYFLDRLDDGTKYCGAAIKNVRLMLL